MTEPASPDAPEPEPADPSSIARVGGSFTREDLEREILGEEPSLTVDEIVGGDLMQLESARRLWRALGFPDPGHAAAFTKADRDAMGLLNSLVESGALDLDTAIKLTRAVGHTMARLADWQVATLSEYIEEVEESGHGTGSRLETGLGVVRGVQLTFEELMMHAWRRHLAAAVSRVEALGAQDSDLHTVRVTVGFADLVSFTRLSNGIDEDRLADLVEGIGGDKALPDVHVGLATGPVVMRLGDVFGPPVNLASRLTGVARRNRVICDLETANVVRDLDGYVIRSLTARAMHGFGMVQPISIRRL